MKTCAAIRHVAFEDLDLLAPELERRGYDITYWDAPLDDLSLLDPAGPDLLVVLGGPVGVYDEPDFPFLGDELKLLEARLAADRPTLGICLGAQLMARALGAKVFKNPRGKEIGWAPVALSEAGRDSALAALGDAPVLHWHGDTFDLPEGASLLASTAITPNQAFARGRALGLQFHVEASALGLERWYVGHVGEISATAGLSVGGLRQDSRRFGAAMAELAAGVLGRWLDRICA